MKSQGQVDYELDLAKTPNYHDGTPRKTWDQLGKLEQWSWAKKRWVEKPKVEKSKVDESATIDYKTAAVERLNQIDKGIVHEGELYIPFSMAVAAVNHDL